MERFDILREVVKEECIIEALEDKFILKRVDGVRFNNVFIKVKPITDSLGMSAYEITLSYKTNMEVRTFHEGDMKFSIKGNIHRLRIEDIDMLPARPIDVQVMSTDRRDVNETIEYKCNDLITTGTIIRIKEICEDSIIYSVLVESRKLEEKEVE